MKSKLIKNLTPIKAYSSDNRCFVEVWNRKYTMTSSPFFSSIISSGKELLSAPMRIVGEENGNAFAFEDVVNSIMHTGKTDETVTCSQCLQTERFVINTVIKTDYDGTSDCAITVSTRGKSVAQVFGLAGLDDKPRILSKLWLEIPLKRDCATHYHYTPHCKARIDGEIPDLPTELYQAGAIPQKSIELPFLQQAYAGCDDAGLAVFFESDRNWQYDDDRRVIEYVVDGDSVILRVHLLDSEPDSWLDKGPSNGIDLAPISFRFGMQVTPIKPFPKNQYKEKNLHIDCFKKILVPYEEFLFTPFEETDEIAFDRIKRLGVTTLYIHEKWNDIQNSPFLTEKAANRLKLIVKEAHKRKIKVIPYFGYELSTLSPLYAEKAEEYVNFMATQKWYRYPYQRALRVCYNSGWQDVFVNGLTALLDEFNFDGLYVDCLNASDPCNNISHGCGYYDKNGRLHHTFPSFAVRNTFKRLFTEVEKRGKVLNCHSYGTFPLCAMAFTSFMWEGESVQAQFMKGKLTSSPVDYYRALYTGRSLGIPVYMLCYSNPPAWTFRQATSQALPFGILPKPVDTGKPLEEMSLIWKAIDSFPIEKAEWKPYFASDVLSSSDSVVASYYKANKQLLLFVASTVNAKTGEVTITLPSVCKTITDALTGKVIAQNTSSFTVEYDTFDYSVITAKI